MKEEDLDHRLLIGTPLEQMASECRNIVDKTIREPDRIVFVTCQIKFGCCVSHSLKVIFIQIKYITSGVGNWKRWPSTATAGAGPYSRESPTAAISKYNGTTKTIDGRNRYRFKLKLVRTSNGVGDAWNVMSSD